ncbi:DUF445 domain-containing protein [Syntrophorhabdus aromaticivorans]|uniref:DUF445 domain-containing protein n=1 Tax=Syntrophorhabdus aromaticivorans TaxID=328301 RepID=UPI00040158A3|nr:DUF445 domain-containing protein [Syntrophorhabdus aromaticivorans]
MKKKRKLGAASLIVVASGLTVIETAIHYELVSGPVWQIIAGGFEAGTVGGLADWFAVSALFREVPIPIIRRHTNIIVKNRARLTEGAVDLVTNQWLAPDVVKAKLQNISFSESIVRVLQEPANQEPAIDLIRDILFRMAEGLDKPQVTEFLERVLKDQIGNLDIAGPLGRWMEDAVREGRHNRLWDVVLDAAEKTINNEETRGQVESRVDQIIHKFKEKDFFKRAFLGVAEFLGILRKDVITGKIIQKMNELTRMARDNPYHPLRARIDSMILDFAHGLSSGDPSLTTVIDGLRSKFAHHADTRGIIQGILSRFRSKLSEQLESKDSAFMLVLANYLREILTDLQNDRLAQKNLDTWVRDTMTNLAEKYHHAIGDMIRTSLHPEKLDDRGLVDQIEEKVGNDLQYIRLNGAVVGGLVGILLGIIRFLVMGR